MSIVFEAEKRPAKRARFDLPQRLPPVSSLLSKVVLDSIIGSKSVNWEAKLLLFACLDVLGDSHWQKVLNIQLKDMSYCVEILTEKKTILHALHACADKCPHNEREWELLFEELSKLEPVVSTSDSTSTEVLLKIKTSPHLKTAFGCDYLALYPDLLLTTMDQYMQAGHGQYYNRSFTMAQSSGMGKSRLVSNSAKLRFTVPFNLHAAIPQLSGDYPFSDDNVREYLTEVIEDYDAALTRHFVFLTALFNLMVEELQKYSPGASDAIAREWDRSMDGSTLTSIGANRTRFYDQVIQEARSLEAEMIEKPVVRQLVLAVAAKAFVGRLSELITNNTGKEFLAIVYFDEAHTLHNNLTLDQRRASYCALMEVLHTLEVEPIFFVFLSTNPSLNTAVPESLDSASLRPGGRMRLIPPFFELPFDVFADNFTTDLVRANKLSLNGVCELDQIAKFGRAMWYPYYQASKNESKISTIQLAQMKMGNGTKNISKLAALDCRVLLQYDLLNDNSRQVQAELIESHMRIIINIPERREFIWSGYLSEPILAEAAARLLNGGESPVDEYAPAILEAALETGLLSPGERGELVVRTLFIIAHDLAVNRHYTRGVDQTWYHRPIRLLHLLEALCAANCWKVIQRALPLRRLPDSPTLQDAFKDAWVNFSHFIKLDDHESFNPECFFELLKRGAAVQAYTDQPDWNVAIPVYFGDPDTSPMCQKNTSYILVQAGHTRVERSVINYPAMIDVNKPNLPFLCMDFQLGAVQHHRPEPPVIITSLPSEISGTKQPPPYYNHRRYEVTLYGCTSQTYNCIPEQCSSYSRILQPNDPFANFPRNSDRRNRDMVRALYPSLRFDRGDRRMRWANIAA